MSRLVPYLRENGDMGMDAVAGAPASAVSTRLEAIGKFVPAEILAFYLPASGAALLAGPDLQRPLQWITFLTGWVAVPAYFLWIARSDERGWRQAVVSSIAFPIWVMASNTFWPLPGPTNTGLALWLLALFSLITAFLLPSRSGGAKAGGLGQ